MDTKPLEKFAQAARRQLHEQVKIKLERVLRTDSAELRAKADTVAELQKQIAATSRETVIERVAYIWFNRFCALRYMDANQYTRIGIVSPAQGYTQPEILQTAKQGHIDPDIAANLNQQTVFDLLTGRIPSRDGQQEAYRLLLVAACNYYHTIMPFLFERIDDYTELLMPDDLLSPGSILTATRDTLTPEVCQDVEVIGWLYQFYISEKKDKVIGAKQPISAENIPAATQLFTPHWIVRYLVENSLGRLWLLNRPHSRLAEQMPFYIKPEQDEAGFLRLTSPEELRICDPAVGSAHMLTYAFDLLYAIYEEEGYSGPEIPRLILEKNLVGLEIDERAGALAAFALVMKARARDRRFFARNVRPHICVLQPITFQEGELRQESWLQKLSLDQQETLRHDLHLFREADNMGSLLQPQTPVGLLTRLRTQLQGENVTDLYAHERRRRVLQALEQAEYLAQKYHVVVANPPYMGSKNMNDRLKKFADDNYPTGKADFFAMFIERGFDLIVSKGYSAMVTMQSWMFLSSYEKLREELLSHATIDCMVHMDNMVMGIAFGTAATVWQKQYRPDFKGHFSYVYYEDLTSENRPREFPVQNERLARAAAADFKKIPGSPIAYWVSNQVRNAFLQFPPFSNFAETRIGLITGNNASYIRDWYEVSFNRIGLGYTRQEAAKSGKKWFPQSKGGDFRRWYGNNQTVVDWSKDGHELQTKLHSSGERILAHNFNLDKIFLEGITWTKISSGMFSARLQPVGFLFNDASANAFVTDQNLTFPLLGFLSSKLPTVILSALNPTLNYLPGNISLLPVPKNVISDANVKQTVVRVVGLSQTDWDSYETSWDFSTVPLLHIERSHIAISTVYSVLHQQWREMTFEMQRLEERNNRLFIEAFGLQDEFTPDVPLEEISLTCNPYYRYDAKKSEAELEALLRADTMREFISYAVGCMFGRYSLDKPGLILANQGDTLDDYLRQVPHPTFPPDKDNAIPILDGDWFPDDISERFKRFLRLTFGDSHYEENLAFIEDAIGRDIRSYFLREFYDHHVKMYKKRPIYWLFSSPNSSFNVLIYMHRYRPDTVSVILNDYLREFRAKLQGHKAHLQQVSISASSSPRDKTRAIKDTEQLDRILNELSDYENNILYPLATRQVQIDLDDGVLVNYNKFGPALKKITGMSKE